MTNFNSLYVRGAAFIVVAFLVDWLGVTITFDQMGKSQPDGSGFINGLIASGAIALLSFSLAAIGVGIILVGCWHQVDSTRRLTD